MIRYTVGLIVYKGILTVKEDGIGAGCCFLSDVCNPITLACAFPCFPCLNIVSSDRRILSVDRRILSVDRRIISVDRRIISVDRRIISVDRRIIC